MEYVKVLFDFPSDSSLMQIKGKQLIAKKCFAWNQFLLNPTGMTETLQISWVNFNREYAWHDFADILVLFVHR